MIKVVLLFTFILPVLVFGQEYTDSLTSKTYIDVKTVEYWMVRYINQERINAGLDTLVLSDDLDKISNTHSSWMCKTGKYEHSKGYNVFEIIMKSGCGPNMISHKRVAEGAVIAWMSSPGHKSIILRKDIKYIGSGFAYKINEYGYASYYYTVNIDY
jgi:uncharacterized protein YkwD